MTKQERIEKAKVHYEDVKKRLNKETIQSIKDTKVYGPNIKTREKVNSTHNLRLVDLDSVSCLASLDTDKKVCILNYASYKHPGGLFLQGSAAQEEALCHESNLFPILSAFDDTFYEWNRGRLNRALYLDRALYTPNVVFEHDGRTILSDVLTCAAPNFRTAHTYQNIPLKLNNEIFKDRINFMYQIAEENNVDTLILGAWGCGVFMQNPLITCQLLTDCLINEGYNIPNVYYAIPDSKTSNYSAFKEVLDNYGKK